MKGYQILGLALAATAVHAQCGCTSSSDPSCWTECGMYFIDGFLLHDPMLKGHFS